MKDYIQDLLKTCIKEIDSAHDVPQELLSKIRVDRTKDRSRGDFATNAALILAKPLHRKPANVAAAIAARIPSSERISKVEVAGPGFINFFVNEDEVAGQLSAMAADPRLGVKLKQDPQVVVVDYSAPNVAKEMAVHHLRSTVIGDAVVRVLEFEGTT